MRTALALALLLLSVAACDTDLDTLFSFGGVDLEARGDAVLAVQDGALVVSGLTGSRSGGFRIPRTLDRLDIEIDALAIPAGGEFGVEVADDAGDVIIALTNRAPAAGTVDFQFEFASALGATAALVRYKLAGALVLEGRLPLSPLREGSRQRAETSAGEGEGKTGSTHVIRENGRYVVVSDSEGSGGRRANGCDGFLITPPLVLGLAVGERICADWVEVEPILTGPVPEGTISVLAQGVGSFTVRDLTATF